MVSRLGSYRNEFSVMDLFDVELRNEKVVRLSCLWREMLGLLVILGFVVTLETLLVLVSLGKVNVDKLC